jgi:hypothetical protein
MKLGLLDGRRREEFLSSGTPKTDNYLTQVQQRQTKAAFGRIRTPITGHESKPLGFNPSCAFRTLVVEMKAAKEKGRRWAALVLVLATLKA